MIGTASWFPRNTRRPSDTFRRTELPPRVGLVCSGGGARTFFHLGFLDRLSQAGIGPERFQCLCGVSAGAIALCPYAAGLDMTEMIDAARRRLTVPQWMSGLPGKRIFHLFRLLRHNLRKHLEREIPNRPLEAMATRLLIVSFDLIGGRPHVHKSGDPVRAVLASTALPPLAKPVRLGQRLLIDGGVWNNLPVQTMNESASVDRVIGIDVSSPVSPRRYSGKSMSRRKIVQSVWANKKMQNEDRQRQSCDLLIRPEMAQFPFADFTRKTADRMVEFGRATAEEALPRIRAMFAGLHSERRSAAAARHDGGAAVSTGRPIEALQH